MEEKVNFVKNITLKRLYYIIYILTLMFFISTNGFSQDTINLLSGKQIVAKSIYNEPASTLLKYEILIKGKIKQRSVDKLDIYSISMTDNTQNLLYIQDSAIGCPLSALEMEHFMLGGREAMKNYKAPWVTVFGFVTGAVATNYIGFWGLSSVIVYPACMGIVGTKIKTSDNVKSDLKANKNFIDGYKTYATKKKVKNALFGSIIGTAALAITSMIINAQ